MNTTRPATSIPRWPWRDTSNDTRSNAQKDAAYLVGTQSYSFGYEITASERSTRH